MRDTFKHDCVQMNVQVACNLAVAHTTRVSTTARPYEPYVSIPLPALILPPFEMNEFVRRGWWWRRGYPYMTANGLSNEANINSIPFRRTAITQFWFIYLFADHFWYDTCEPSSVLGAWLISNFETKLARNGEDKADDDEMVTKTNRNESDLIGSWS